MFRLILAVVVSLSAVGIAAVPAPTVERALARRAAGDLRGALTIAEAAAMAHPADGAAWRLAGDFRYALGDREGARDAYAAAAATGVADARVAGLVAELGAHPAVPLAGYGTAAAAGTAGRERDATYLRALAMFETGQAGPATELAAALVAADPAHWEGWTLLGRCRAVRGDPAGAREAFAKSLALHPDQPDLVVLTGLAPPAESPDAATTAGLPPHGADVGMPPAAGPPPLPGASRSPARNAPPVLPGTVRSGESTQVPPPSSILSPREAAGHEPEWPEIRSEGDGGGQGPRGSSSASRDAAFSFGMSGGVMGPGLATLRARDTGAAEERARLLRSAGATVSVDSTAGGPRIPVALELRWRAGPGWGLLGRGELTTESEDVSRLDIRSPFYSVRLVETTRRRSGFMGATAGGWAGREFAPGWVAGGLATLGGLYAWRTVVSEDAWWWNPAGPPERDAAAVSWRGWGILGDLAVETSYAVWGPLRVTLEAGRRFAWVPRMSATVAIRDLDGDGVRDPEQVVDREPRRHATRYDFSAWRVLGGFRLVF